MFLSDKNDHAMVTIYGDDPDHTLAKALNSVISDKDIKVLTPGTPEILEQAAQNSVLILIGVSFPGDPNLALAGRLKDNRMVTADIIAFLTGEPGLPTVEILSKGFDAVLTPADAQNTSFSRFIQNKIAVGSRRVATAVLEEEYRRVCDTLSNAPASMIVFDHDKRCVFVSDHYFRAYPRVASRLTRGISVYDAFELMASEEGFADKKDPLYLRLQHFWYNLEGTIEFTLDRGISYRLKAVKLPNKRGVLVMAQNISNYRTRNAELENMVLALQKQLLKLTDL